LIFLAHRGRSDFNNEIFVRIPLESSRDVDVFIHTWSQPHDNEHASNLQRY
jgi:hypothetical protein